MEIILQTIITCPNCGHGKEEIMPTDACRYFYECENCRVVLKPRQGDCCVYCSYGSVKCPPKQQDKKCCWGLYTKVLSFVIWEWERGAQMDNMKIVRLLGNPSRTIIWFCFLKCVHKFVHFSEKAVSIDFVARTGIEPVTFGLWARRATAALPRDAGAKVRWLF